MQPPGKTLARQWPERDVVVRVGAAPYPRVGHLGCPQQFVGADRQRFGETGEMVQGQATLARLEAAEGGHVDAGATSHVLERQTALNTQFPQPPSNPQVDIVLRLRHCLHGK